MARKMVRFQVNFDVEDHGELDTRMLGGAIEEGLRLLRNEGAITREDDLTTDIKGWQVTHLGTMAEPN